MSCLIIWSTVRIFSGQPLLQAEDRIGERRRKFHRAEMTQARRSRYFTPVCSIQPSVSLDFSSNFVTDSIGYEGGRISVSVASNLKDEGAFQHKEFFALCPSQNSWQIDAMNAKRKFQVFVILLLASGILVQAMEFA